LGFSQGQGLDDKGAGLIAQILEEGTGVLPKSILISLNPKDSLQEDSSAQLIIFNVKDPEV